MPSSIAPRIPRAGARSRARAALLAAALLLLLMPAASPAAAPPPATPAAPPSETAAIQAAVDAGLAAIATLETQAKDAPDGEQALDLQARIGQTKRDLQRQVLDIQLDYARRAGRADQAAAIEAALARLANPPAGEPQPRPLPPTAPAAH